MAHAYIFTGPDGVGKALFAKELVKTFFCESEGIASSCQPSQHGLDACDNCRACLRVESGNHPDVHWIALEKKDKEIKLEHIHSLQDNVALKPVEAAHKVFIINEADKMNEESSNCLLKTLEEPPPDTIIILITTSVKSLKKTIASRCQIVRFNPLPSSTIEAELATRFDTKSETLKWVSKSSFGSLGRAINFLEKSTYERANYIIKKLTSLKSGDNLSFAKEIIEWDSFQGETLEEKRSRLRPVLHIFLQFYRDALLYKTLYLSEAKEGIEDIPLYNQYKKDLLKSLCRNLTRMNLINIIGYIVTSIEYLDSNVNINLLLENLLAKIALAQMPNLKK